MSYFVAGGLYMRYRDSEGNPIFDDDFSFVSPTGGAPYVRREKDVPQFENVTKHHAHIYKVFSYNEKIDCIDLRLHSFSYEADGSVKALRRLSCSGDKARQVIQTIKEMEKLDVVRSP